MPGDSIRSIAALWGMLIVFVAQGAMADEIGVVKDVQGDASVARAQETLAVVIGLDLHEGDVLETGKDAAVGAILSDGTVISVGENTRLALDRYQFDPGESLFELVIRVLTGRFVYSSGRIGEQAPDKVRIETPQLTVGTRGTKFAVIAPQPVR